MKNIFKNQFIIIFLATVLLSTTIYADVEVDPFKHIYRHVDKETTILDDNTITFYEIEDLVFHNNPIVKNLWNNYDIKDELDDISDRYYEAADSIEGVGDDEVTEASNYAKAVGLRIQGDNNVNDKNISYLENLIQEKTIIYNTQVAYISYQKAMKNSEKATKNKEEAVRTLDSSTTNFNLGNITRSEHLKTRNNYSSTNANVIIADNELLRCKREILINCGFGMDDAIEIFPQGHVDTSAVDVALSLGLDNNTAIAMNNNLKYEIYKRSLQNARTEEVKNTYKINVDNAKNYISSDIKKKYLDLQDAYTEYKNKKSDINYFKNEYDSSITKKNEGLISDNEYKTYKYNYDISLIDAEIAYYDLDIAYLAYLSAIEGLANAGNI